MSFNVSIDDVLFWMDAIRNSKDRDRVLESFWKGQVQSKIWLIENLKQHIECSIGYRIAIYGGWNGVLSSLLFNSDISISNIVNIDIDHSCENIARTVNKRQEIEGRFDAITADMEEYECQADIVINTSCEHITRGKYNRWLNIVPNDALIVLQSNNYNEIHEHINCMNNIEEFVKESKLEILQCSVLSLPKYDRYMIIGKKNETTDRN